MHEEYKPYDQETFSSRLSKLREIYDDCMHRKSMDEEAFNIFLHNHKPSLFSHKGYPEWQGSNAQSLLRGDIEADKHNGMSKIDLWDSRAEYFEDFPLDVFRDKIKQEIRTAKYLHTCREKGKLHVASLYFDRFKLSLRYRRIRKQFFLRRVVILYDRSCLFSR